MPFHPPMTIKKALENIRERRYLLPAIQREFVWAPEQIEKLFDSILSGYPIGSFLFWEVKKDRLSEYQFYEFIRNFHARDNCHNEKADVSGAEGVTAILDGQQRLTALYIGLRGSYAYKTKWKHWSAPDAFPARKLHLNLLSPMQALDRQYEFRFLAEGETTEEGKHWFPVPKILDFNGPHEVYGYLVQHGIASEFAGQCLFKLHEAITNLGLITPFVEEAQDLDKVLQIFIRVNSGGTPLNYSDLLLSIATAQWTTRDARTEIHELVDDLNQIGQGFSFDKDFVMKACLVLAGISDIRFKVSNFNAQNMEAIEAKWPEIVKALRLAVSLVASFGFHWATLTSNNSVIPLAYYLLKKGLPANYVEGQAHREDRRAIRKLLAVSLLKGTYGDQADTVLAQMRAAINESHEEFPVGAITTRLVKMNKSFRFEPEEIEDLLAQKYGHKHTFSTLALLYPSLDFKNMFHQDHIHPKSAFHKKKLRARGVPEEKLDTYADLVDRIPNLQLLEGTPNQEKSDRPFEEWLESAVPADQRSAYRDRHFIPDTAFDLLNFETFFEGRRKLMFARLQSLLAT